jgi:hypothetical protein
VSGVVAAYLILYPRVKVWGLFLKGIPLKVPAYGAIGFWVALQVVSAFFGGDDAVGGSPISAASRPAPPWWCPMRRSFDPVLARVEATQARLVP